MLIYISLIGFKLAMFFSKWKLSHVCLNMMSILGLKGWFLDPYKVQ